MSSQLPSAAFGAAALPARLRTSPAAALSITAARCCAWCQIVLIIVLTRGRAASTPPACLSSHFLPAFHLSPAGAAEPWPPQDDTSSGAARLGKCAWVLCQPHELDVPRKMCKENLSKTLLDVFGGILFFFAGRDGLRV